MGGDGTVLAGCAARGRRQSPGISRRRWLQGVAAWLATLWLAPHARADGDHDVPDTTLPTPPPPPISPPPPAPSAPPVSPPPPARARPRPPAPFPVVGDADRAWQAPNGRFFPAGPDGGFLVGNDTDAALWSSYLDLGAAPALGAPISGRFVRDGAIHQAFERAVLRWSPAAGRAEPVNLLDELSRAGADEWLAANKQVPPPEPGGWDVPARMGWLTEPRLRDAYYARPASPFLLWWDAAQAGLLRGLPTSRPQQGGPVLAQRFQRSVLQLWVASGPGLPPQGTVTESPVGVYAALAGWVPAEALSPGPPAPRLQWEQGASNALATRPVVRQGSGARRVIALTFDDGPSDYTPQLLEVLAALRVRATFYVIGRQAAGNLALVRRMVNEGHVVGNHTWSHPQLPRLSPPAVADQLNRAEDALYAALGFRPALFRPPYGALDGAVREMAWANGFSVDLWSDDPTDWRGGDPARIVAGVLRQAAPGGIVVMHDGGGPRAATVAAVPEIVARLRADGYDLVTVPELMG